MSLWDKFQSRTVIYGGTSALAVLLGAGILHGMGMVPAASDMMAVLSNSASSKVSRMNPMRPSIMSDGATTSAPARA